MAFVADTFSLPITETLTPPQSYYDYYYGGGGTPAFASTSILDKISAAAIAAGLSLGSVVQAWRAGSTVASTQPQATSATSFVSSAGGLILLVVGVVVLAVILGRR